MEIETRSNTCLYAILVFIIYTSFMYFFVFPLFFLDQELVRLIVVDFFLAKTYMYLICDKNLN